MRESQIENYLVARVNALGGEVRKVKWIGRNSAPDRIVMISGNSFWAEIKAPGIQPTPAQIREHARMRKVGQRVEVIDSMDQVDGLLA